MAARFSTGHLADADELVGRADGLRGEVVVLARADAAAYGRVLDAHRTSRDDKEARRRERLPGRGAPTDTLTSRTASVALFRGCLTSDRSGRPTRAESRRVVASERLLRRDENELPAPPVAPGPELVEPDMAYEVDYERGNCKA